MLNLQFGLSITAAHIAAYAGGMCSSFLFNWNWTFSSGPGRLLPELMKFYWLNLFTLLLSLMLLKLFTAVMGLPALEAKMAATVISLAVNFTGSKLWVFRHITSQSERKR